MAQQQQQQQLLHRELYFSFPELSITTQIDRQVGVLYKNQKLNDLERRFLLKCNSRRRYYKSTKAIKRIEEKRSGSDDDDSCCTENSSIEDDEDFTMSKFEENDDDDTNYTERQNQDATGPTTMFSPLLNTVSVEDQMRHLGTFRCLKCGCGLSTQNALEHLDRYHLSESSNNNNNNNIDMNNVAEHLLFTPDPYREDSAVLILHLAVTKLPFQERVTTNAATQLNKICPDFIPSTSSSQTTKVSESGEETNSADKSTATLETMKQHFRVRRPPRVAGCEIGPAAACDDQVSIEYPSFRDIDRSIVNVASTRFQCFQEHSRSSDFFAVTAHLTKEDKKAAEKSYKEHGNISVEVKGGSDCNLDPFLGQRTTDYRLVLAVTKKVSLAVLASKIAEIWLKCGCGAAAAAAPAANNNNNNNNLQGVPGARALNVTTTPGTHTRHFSNVSNNTWFSERTSPHPPFGVRDKSMLEPIEKLLNEVGDRAIFLQDGNIHAGGIDAPDKPQTLRIEIDVVRRIDGKSTLGGKVIPLLRNWKFLSPYNLFQFGLKRELISNDPVMICHMMKKMQHLNNFRFIGFPSAVANSNLLLPHKDRVEIEEVVKTIVFRMTPFCFIEHKSTERTETFLKIGFPFVESEFPEEKAKVVVADEDDSRGKTESKPAINETKQSQQPKKVIGKPTKTKVAKKAPQKVGAKKKVKPAPPKRQAKKAVTKKKPILKKKATPTKKKDATKKKNASPKKKAAPKRQQRKK